MQETILSIDRLSKDYKKQKAVNQITLNLKKGEILGIVGGNGAGKTTLFRMIAGLTSPSSGSLSLFGAPDEIGNQKNRSLISAIIEEPAFIPYFTAEENLEFYRLQRGVMDKGRIKDLVKLVGLDQAKDKKFKEYSLGMRQRLALALALLHRPRLMIFDEPTNGLDPTGIRDFRHLVRRLAHEEGVGILISSHILSELEQVADRFILLSQGQEVTRFTKEELNQRLRNYYVIETSRPTEVTQILEESFTSSHYEVKETGDIHLYDLSLSLEEINRTLITQGVPVGAIYSQKSMLEDIYIDELESQWTASSSL